MQTQSTCTVPAIAAAVPATVAGATAVLNESANALIGTAGTVDAPPSVAVQPKPIRLLNRANLRSFLDNQNGLLVSLDYVKLDGQARTLHGRLGVRAFLKGGHNTVEAYERPYLTMFDFKIRQYRTVDLSTVHTVRAVGETWRIVD